MDTAKYMTINTGLIQADIDALNGQINGFQMEISGLQSERDQLQNLLNPPAETQEVATFEGEQVEVTETAVEGQVGDAV